MLEVIVRSGSWPSRCAGRCRQIATLIACALQPVVDCGFHIGLNQLRDPHSAQIIKLSGKIAGGPMANVSVSE